MKKVILFIFIIILILLSSCKRVNKPINTSTSTSESALTSESTTETTSNTLDKYLRLDLPQLRRENQRIYYVEWGKLSEASYSDCVYILSDTQYAKKLQSDIYIVADVGGNPIVQELGTFDKMVIENGKLSLADLNGDDIDEIVVHFEVSGNGGTITRLYKVENGSIILLSNLDDFDTCFTSEFENNYKLRIINKNTGYVQEVDISKFYFQEFFDENGKAIVKDDIFVLPFSSCEVKDEDKNGEFELFCSQDVLLSRGYIGNIYTTLRYNSEINNFEVIKSEFVLK